MALWGDWVPYFRRGQDGDRGNYGNSQQTCLVVVWWHPTSPETLLGRWAER